MISLNDNQRVYMKNLKEKIQDNAHIALSVPTVLCAITFVTNLFSALKDGNIDNSEMHQLLASADGFETVILVVVMFVLNGKKK